MTHKDDPPLAADANWQKVTITRRKGARALLTATLATLTGTATLMATSSKAHAGMGYCWKCKCQAYQGNQNVCDNCGHNYTDHN
jgi:hypothetical protein